MPAATPATMTRPSPGQGGCDDWRDRAACRGTDPELFFPVGSVGPALVQLGRAKQLCASCPVRTECLEWALANDQETGVWGGTNEDERRALRRARQAGARADAGGTAALHTQAALRPMDEGLIQAHVLAARAVCARMTGARLHALHDSGQRA
jgi:WhiB family redox-sensing transcriptional regulator